MIKSKRIISISSMSNRASIHKVSEKHNSCDESESDDDEMAVDDSPVTYEYVYGSPSPVFLYKCLGFEESHIGVAQISKTQSKLDSKSLNHLNSTSAKKSLYQSNQERSNELSADESAEELSETETSNFPRILNSIFEFFRNRKNWSVTEESIIIWFGFMFFSIIVGCILHFLMA